MFFLLFFLFPDTQERLQEAKKRSRLDACDDDDDDEMFEEVSEEHYKVILIVILMKILLDKYLFTNPYLPWHITSLTGNRERAS